MLYSPVLLLDFWATTCGPCRPVLKTLQALHLRFPPLRIRSVPMDGPETMAGVKPLLRQEGVTYPVSLAFAKNQQFAKAFHVQTYPSLFLLDGKGKICWSHSGPLSQEALGALLKQIMALEAVQKATSH